MTQIQKVRRCFKPTSTKETILNNSLWPTTADK